MSTDSLPLSALFLPGEALEELRGIPTGSVDLVCTSPPFLGLRSYTDDPRELGTEDPGRYLSALLAIIAECRRVLAPHGSLVVELGDTYSGSGGAGGDYGVGHALAHKRRFKQSNEGDWPLAKSLCCVPSLVAVALAYGIHPLLGEPSPAGRWLLRNTAVWLKPAPRPGREGDKFRNAWSMILCAALNANRYWHEPSARRPARDQRATSYSSTRDGAAVTDTFTVASSGGSEGHEAPWPEELVRRLIDCQAPLLVCTECGLPSRYVVAEDSWTDCKHGAWRRGTVLDPFCGSGSTLAVAVGSGRDAIGIDIDGSNYERLSKRIGPLVLLPLVS